MSRKAKLNSDCVDAIRNDRLSTQKELAKVYGVSLLTIWKVKNFKGTYAIKIEGTPVLNAHGEEVDFIPSQSTD